MTVVDIDDLIEIAEEAEYCPYCGNSSVDGHYCKECNERVSVPVMVPKGFVRVLKRMRDERAKPL